jgi:hypothetical protein
MDAYCIEIRVSPQGITVGVEPEQAEQGEMQEPTGTPVKSIEEALQQAQAIYAAQGEDPTAADAQGDKDFTAGFA